MPPGRDPWHEWTKQVAYIANRRGPKRESSTCQGQRQHGCPPGEDAFPTDPALIPNGREGQVAEGDIEGKPHKQKLEAHTWVLEAWDVTYTRWTLSGTHVDMLSTHTDTHSIENKLKTAINMWGNVKTLWNKPGPLNLPASAEEWCWEVVNDSEDHVDALTMHTDVHSVKNELRMPLKCIRTPKKRHRPKDSPASAEKWHTSMGNRCIDHLQRRTEHWEGMSLHQCRECLMGQRVTKKEKPTHMRAMTRAVGEKENNLLTRCQMAKSERTKRQKETHNYHLLDNPWADNNEMSVVTGMTSGKMAWMTSTERVYAMSSGPNIMPDNPKNLREVWESPDWPNWEVVKAELDQPDNEESTIK